VLTANGTPVAWNADGTPKILPQLLYLNVRPLLPPEVKDGFEPGELPQMLLSPRYMALETRKSFDAIFGVTDRAIRIRNTFTGTFDVGDLLGNPGPKLGCGRQTAAQIVASGKPMLDVVVTISERYKTAGVSPGKYNDVLINSNGCTNPSATVRWSMYGYGLQLAKAADLQSNGTYKIYYPDTVYARLLLALGKDLTDTISTYLCKDGDLGGSPPVGTGCSTLSKSWGTTFDKLKKCVESSTNPLVSTTIRTCNAFETQWASYLTTLKATRRSGDDPANRWGEVQARTQIIRWAYDEQYKPSIPADGYFKDGL